MSEDQVKLSHEALHRREKAAAAEAGHRPENSDHADKGIISTPRPDYPPSGAFDAEGHKPALERGGMPR